MHERQGPAFRSEGGVFAFEYPVKIWNLS